VIVSKRSGNRPEEKKKLVIRKDRKKGMVWRKREEKTRHLKEVYFFTGYFCFFFMNKNFRVAKEQRGFSYLPSRRGRNNRDMRVIALRGMNPRPGL
jgi:hypothetical protein